MFLFFCFSCHYHSTDHLSDTVSIVAFSLTSLPCRRQLYMLSLSLSQQSTTSRVARFGVHFPPNSLRPVPPFFVPCYRPVLPSKVYAYSSMTNSLHLFMRGTLSWFDPIILSKTIWYSQLTRTCMDGANNAQYVFEPLTQLQQDRLFRLYDYNFWVLRIILAFVDNFLVGQWNGTTACQAEADELASEGMATSKQGYYKTSRFAAVLLYRQQSTSTLRHGAKPFF